MSLLLSPYLSCYANLDSCKDINYLCTIFYLSWENCIWVALRIVQLVCFMWWTALDTRWQTCCLYWQSVSFCVPYVLFLQQGHFTYNRPTCAEAGSLLNEPLMLILIQRNLCTPAYCKVSCGESPFCKSCECLCGKWEKSLMIMRYYLFPD